MLQAGCAIASSIGMGKKHPGMAGTMIKAVSSRVSLEMPGEGGGFRSQREWPEDRGKNNRGRPPIVANDLNIMRAVAESPKKLLVDTFRAFGYKSLIQSSK